MKVKEILILFILGYFAVTKIEAVSLIDKRQILKNHPCMYAPISCFRKRATLIPQIPQDILKSAMLKVITFFNGRSSHEMISFCKNQAKFQPLLAKTPQKTEFALWHFQQPDM
jgi:hypothetical protein